MAIAFARAASTSSISTNLASPITLNITINDGETPVLFFGGTTSPLTINSITGGGKWIFGGADQNDVNIQLWTTYAGRSTATSTVTIAFSGTSPTLLFGVSVYTGVGSIGSSNANSSAGSANPSIPLGTQDSNNCLIAGFIIDSATAPTQDTSGTVRTSQPGALGIVDVFFGSPGGQTLSVVHSSAVWEGAAIELRSFVPTLTGVVYTKNNSRAVPMVTNANSLNAVQIHPSVGS